jgi:hypothetical protein
MINVRELKAWVDSVAHDPEALVYVDEGGLTLCVVGRTAYIEVGGDTDDDAEAQS